MKKERAIDLSGKRFGRLTVIKRDYSKKASRKWAAWWLCACDCGEAKIVRTDTLKSNKIISCGCYTKEIKIKNSTKHGMYKTRFYNIWGNVRKRGTFHVYNGNYSEIDICEKWLKFEGFMEDMYESYIEHVRTHGEKNTSIDRINGLEGYYKENCRWATRSVQSRNMRTNIFLEYGGKRMCLKDWSDFIGLSEETLRYRIKKGLDIAKILSGKS